MATFEDLKEALKETLDNRGVLNQLKACVRAEVFKALDDESAKRPTPSNENLLINELIREYLEYNRYLYTKSVFTAETNHPSEPLPRDFVAKELRVEETLNSRRLPLLYSLVLSNMPSTEHLPGQRETKVNRDFARAEDKTSERRREVEAQAEELPAVYIAK